MDFQDSSSIAPPPPQQQQQPLQNHQLLQQHMSAGPPQNQSQSQHHQQPQLHNSYEAAAAAASAFHSSSVSAASTMAHHHQQQNQLFQQLQQQQQQSLVPFSSMVNSTPQIMPSMDYSEGGNVTSPPTGGGGGSVAGTGSGIEVVKRKRGRPRKFPSDGSASGIAIGGSSNPTVAHTESGGGSGAVDAEPPVKKQRGRPPGSGKKQLDALGAPGIGFTPHVIMVKPGEDIATQLMAYIQKGPRTVCILTANGAVCNVILRQPSSSGSIRMYEGVFEIVSLTGSFLMSENNGGVRTGGLSVGLAREDGSVLGGGVAGILKAATPVQIIVASFILDERKHKSMPAVVPPPNVLSFVNAGATEASPPSQGGGASSSSSGENGCPLDQGAYANAGQPLDQGAYANAGQTLDQGAYANAGQPLDHAYANAGQPLDQDAYANAGQPLDQGAYANAGQPLQNLPMYSSMIWRDMHPN